MRPPISISSLRSPPRLVCPPFPQAVTGVGRSDVFVFEEPPESLSDVRRVNGASRDINRPSGIATAFQVRSNSVEPIAPSLSRNLFSHDDRRPSGTDEPMKVRPQMPWIIGSGAFSRDAERLARTGASPEDFIVWPPGKSCCNTPNSPTCKKMTLREALQIVGLDVGD